MSEPLLGTSTYRPSGETTTSDTFTDLTTVGPVVTLTTGVMALAFYCAAMSTSTVNAHADMTPRVDGASSIDEDDNASLRTDNETATGVGRWGVQRMFTDLTPGSNDFTLRYRVEVNTTTGTFAIACTVSSGPTGCRRPVGRLGAGMAAVTVTWTTCTSRSGRAWS